MLDIYILRLWKNVSEAVVSNDMHTATQEKFILEERQRHEAKERKMKMEDWVPKLFERDSITGEWVYRYIELVCFILRHTVITPFEIFFAQLSD